jgi:hypothetical protein
MKVPDGIQPIDAFRLWIYTLEEWNARLDPLRGRLTQWSEWDGAGSRWVSASWPLPRRCAQSRAWAILLVRFLCGQGALYADQNDSAPSSGPGRTPCRTGSRSRRAGGEDRRARIRISGGASSHRRAHSDQRDRAERQSFGDSVESGGRRVCCNAVVESPSTAQFILPQAASRGLGSASRGLGIALPSDSTLKAWEIDPPVDLEARHSADHDLLVLPESTH